MLYHPTHGEIDAVIPRGIAKQPALTSRFLRASVILTTGALTYRGSSWHCESQSHRNEVHAVDFHGCACLRLPQRRRQGRRRALLQAQAGPAGAQRNRRRPDCGALRGHLPRPRRLRPPAHGAPTPACCSPTPATAALQSWPPSPTPATTSRPASAARAGRRAVTGRPTKRELAKLLTWLDDALRLPPVIEAEMLFRRGKADGLPDVDAAALADEALIARYVPVDW